MSKPNSTTTVLKVIAGLSLLSTAAACGSDNGGGGPLESQLGFDEARSEVVVKLNRSLGGGEKVHVRVRSLADGDNLDCAAEQSLIPTVGSMGDNVYGGQSVTQDMFEDPSTPSALLGETPEELQTRLEGTFYVDVCIENGGEVLHQARYSIMEALDLLGENGKFDANDDGVRIASGTAYAQACEVELGPNPMFAPVEGSPGDYEMASCLNGTPIPTEVDGVPADDWVDQCDKPQYIYSHCEPDARTGANGPRVQSARNEQGTSWVLLCRKSLDEEGWYNDLAMIGNNPFTGKTCFFQNKLRASNGNQTRDGNGNEVVWPGDDVDSETSPKGDVMWMDNPVGGSNVNIECAKCHDADAFVHSPWIDGALDEDGNAVVPKIGEHPDYVEGYNRPYSLLDQTDQGWTIPRRLVSEEAGACTSCHAMGNGQWIGDAQHPDGEGCNGGFCGAAPWGDRMVGENAGWAGLVTDSHQGFDDVFWMPPNAGEVLNADEWENSEYAAAMDFMFECGSNPENPACIWEAAPTEPGDPTELPTIDTTGPELARAALAAIGARYLDEANNEVDQTRRCSECHAISPYGMREWRDRTQGALSAGIDFDVDPDEMDQAQAMDLINYMRKDSSNTDSVFAPFKIGVYSAGAQFPYFRKLFDKAFGGEGAIQYSAFLARVSMPKGSHPPFSAEEFATVLKWFVDEDIANLEAVMPEAPRPETCADVTAFAGLGSNGIPADDAWFEGHLDDMQFEGWHARNVENGINMFGCDGTAGTDCFDGFDRAGFSVRAADTDVVVAEFDFDTSYWMRTSADGRFIGNGGGGADTNFSATVTDVIAGRDIGVRGSYDPGFFPNNEGFIMQGSGAGLCGQSVLSNTDAIADGIDFTEDGCSNAEGINLYQHVAVNLEGGDYFIINSQFTSDPGSGNSDPTAGFGEGAAMKFSPLVFNGGDWDQKDAIDVASPYEGDSVLSPSGRLVVSRFAGPDGVALGYMYRRVQTTPAGSGYDVNINLPVRFVCTPGAKANISFDERFSVTHTYENGTANLYLTDLVTMETHQITDMPEGTRALFPHFRSDGWIMFLVQGDGPDRAVGIDSAVVLANQ